MIEAMVAAALALVPACADDAPSATEVEQVCHWNAAERGNNRGDSFLYVNGAYFYTGA